MKLPFLDKLACPFDKHDLRIKVITQEQQEILEGILTCTHCERYYPIVQGIPIMSPDEYREAILEATLLNKWGEGVLIDGRTSAFKLIPLPGIQAK